MKVIYIAGPYSADTYSGIEDNIRKSELVSIQLLRQGWAILCPHKNTAHYDMYDVVVNSFTYEFWLEMTTELLNRCDAIFMMKDWEKSKGARNELKHATQNKIPIFYEDQGFPNPIP